MLIAFSINMIRRASTGTMTFRTTAAGVRKGVQNLSAVQVFTEFVDWLSHPAFT